MTFVQNRVINIRKNVPSEKWNFCSTKVNPADLIIRLEKGIDLKKILCGGEVFVFYLKKIKIIIKLMTARVKKRFLKLLHKILKVRSKKNVVITGNKIEHLIPSTVDNIIKASNYSDINRLFRVTAFVVRFVKNLFRKVKGENLKLFNYADANEIYEAKIHWVKANQLLLLKSENYENLSKN